MTGRRRLTLITHPFQLTACPISRENGKDKADKAVECRSNNPFLPDRVHGSCELTDPPLYKQRKVQKLQQNHMHCNNLYESRLLR